MTMEKDTMNALKSIFKIDGTEIECGFGDYRKPNGLPDWYGIRGIKFVYYNDWTDPKLYYKKHLINSYLIEDTMWEDYSDECKTNGIVPSDGGFENYMHENANEVYELLDETITIEVQS
jgi:hypothetical protein